MRAVTSSQGSIVVSDHEEPTGTGELITVTSAGICGSDLHLVASGLSGVILGHEFGGFTADGRLVAVRPTGECGSCPQCASGFPHTCREAAASLHGTSINGGLAEFVRVQPSRLVPVPDGTDPAIVGLVEPLAVVIHGVNRVPLIQGMSAVVIGSGSIGLLTASVLADRGITVDIVCRHPHQFEAAEKLGINAVAKPGANYDVSFDAVCTQESLDACFNATRPRGSVVEFGMIWSSIQLKNQMMLKEISLVPSIFYSHNHEHNDFEDAVDMLVRHPEITNTLVTHRFSLEESIRAFEVANDRQAGAIKVHIFSRM
ncbi:MAG: zinc-dependent alcohol dehydrogenase [Ilumatobacteraceae bacterium]|jgi:threonine dehydrogenase-like Zn-dependent dehydrogenase